MEKVIVTARIDGQGHRDLKQIAEREDRSLSYLVRKAVEQFLTGKSVSSEAKSGRDSESNI